METETCNAHIWRNSSPYLGHLPLLPLVLEVLLHLGVHLVQVPDVVLLALQLGPEAGDGRGLGTEKGFANLVAMQGHTFLPTYGAFTFLTTNSQKSIISKQEG